MKKEKKMVAEEKKRNISYGSIFVFCFFCFVFVAEVVRFVKPNYDFKQNVFTERDVTVTEAIAEAVVEGSHFVMDSISPCNSRRSGLPRRKQHEKLEAPIGQWRERPPTTYCIKFESFRTLLNLVKDGKYVSRPFSSGGYNWTYEIYPNGDKRVGANGLISLYVRIDNSTLITNPQDVYAEIKFFVYNRKQDKYYSYHEPEAARFHLFKTEWGIPSIQSTANYLDPTTGYVFDGDQCVFGVDVFVAQPFKKWEVFSFDEHVNEPIFSWKLTHLSTSFSDSYTSGTFTSGGRNWVLKVYPNGDGYGKGNSLSLYLLSESNEKAYVRAKLRVLDQINSNHVEKLVEGWPNAAENSGWGFEKFVPLADLKDQSRGLVVDDALKVEVEIIAFSKTDSTLNA
ncbi:hypothetical protein HID58_034214 [Brassica napus]|uniref:MATH domain-containing protein n=2 Tax=Brassica napus TaxID=3708 RepID=A0ABQ8C1N3_BRANA|nr:hypothetical protein HID58_034214 [Brassica napus]